MAITYLLRNGTLPGMPATNPGSRAQRTTYVRHGDHDRAKQPSAAAAMEAAIKETQLFELSIKDYEVMNIRWKDHSALSGGSDGYSLLRRDASTTRTAPGLEYMPDMYRSPAVEAYVDYGQDPLPSRGGSTPAAQRMVQSARKPVAGTIAFASRSTWRLLMPYPYPNTVAGVRSCRVRPWQFTVGFQIGQAEIGGGTRDLHADVHPMPRGSKAKATAP